MQEVKTSRERALEAALRAAIAALDRYMDSIRIGAKGVGADVTELDRTHRGMIEAFEEVLK